MQIFILHTKLTFSQLILLLLHFIYVFSVHLQLLVIPLFCFLNHSYTRRTLTTAFVQVNFYVLYFCTFFF